MCSGRVNVFYIFHKFGHMYIVWKIIIMEIIKSRCQKKSDQCYLNQLFTFLKTCTILYSTTVSYYYHLSGNVEMIYV